MMRALTLWQPWAWAIPLFKDVENRPWAPPDDLLGERFAITAAVRRNNAGELEQLKAWRDTEPMPPIVRLDALPRGAVTAVATLVGWCRLNDRGKIVDVQSLDRTRYVMRRVGESRHAQPGKYCWLLDDRIALPRPVECRGYQKLWRLPENVERAVRRQLRRRA